MVTVGSESCQITLDYLTLENFLLARPASLHAHASARPLDERRRSSPGPGVDFGEPVPDYGGVGITINEVLVR